jgi:hypothetical protein
MTDIPQHGEHAASVAFSEPTTAIQRPAGRFPFGIGRATRPRVGRPKAPVVRRPFRGPRLTDRIGFWRRLRSVVELVFVTLVLGVLLAAIVAAVVGAIVLAVQNALNA